MVDFDFRALAELKKHIVIGLFSNDDLMQLFVLKGGSALDLAYAYAAGRSSLDVDLSMPDDFAPDALGSAAAAIEGSLSRYLREKDHVLFDFKFVKKPEHPRGPVPDFWGGYAIEFKLTTGENHARFAGDINALRRNATVVGPGHTRIFTIELSKKEYCAPKREFELDGHLVYVYTPLMIVCEKLRAICQKMPEYEFGRSSNTGHRAKRARDFYDIFVVLEHERSITWGDSECRSILVHMFAAKRVDLALLGRVSSSEVRAFHEDDFPSVRDTVPAGVELREFRFYFDYVAAMLLKLQVFWEVQPPRD